MLALLVATALLVLALQGVACTLAVRHPRWPPWTLWVAPLGVLCVAWVLHAKDVRDLRDYHRDLGPFIVPARAVQVIDALGTLVAANLGAAVLFGLAALAYAARAWRRGRRGGAADALGGLAAIGVAVVTGACFAALREIASALRTLEGMDVGALRGMRIFDAAWAHTRRELGVAIVVGLAPLAVALVLALGRAAGRRAVRRAGGIVCVVTPLALALAALSALRARAAYAEVVGPAADPERWPRLPTVALSTVDGASLEWTGDEVVFARATDALPDDAACTTKMRNVKGYYFSGSLAVESALDTATLYRLVSAGARSTGGTHCVRAGGTWGERNVRLVVRVHEAASASFYAALPAIAIGSPPEIDDPPLLYVSPAALRLRRARAAPIEEGSGVLDALPEGKGDDRVPIIVTASKDTPASVLVPILAKATRRRFFSLEEPGATWPPAARRASLRVVYVSELDGAPLSHALASAAEALRPCVWGARTADVTISFPRGGPVDVRYRDGEAFVFHCAMSRLPGAGLPDLGEGFAIVSIAGIADEEGAPAGAPP